MAVYRNLDGTTASSFKIGKGGTTFFQGDSQPTGANGDFWFDPTSAELKVRVSGTWELIRFDNLKLSGNTISSLDTDGDISIVPDGLGDVVLGTAGAGTSTMTAPDDTSVVIEAGPGTGAGNGGDLTLKGGTPEGAGSYGNVILGVTGGGSSTMTAPDDTDVILVAGPGGSGDNPGGNFYIRGGTGIGAGADGDVIIDVGNLSVTGSISGSNISGTNTGDQTSIVGITGTLAQFNTALTDATFATGGGTITGSSSGTNTGDEPSASTTVPGIVELATITETNTGTDATRAVTPDGLDGWTGSAQLATVGTITSGTWQGSAISTTYVQNLSGTNTGDQTSIAGITGTLAQFNTALTDATFATGGGTITGSSSGTNTGDEPSASTTVPGIVELATITETNTGTDTTRAVTPDGLDGWTGSAQITTVGTISSGTWQGSAIDQTYITGLSGTNTGDQTSIAGITGTLAQFNTALTDATFATGGGTVTGSSSGTNTGDQVSGDFDHNSLTNTHNLTTDIDHNQLTNSGGNQHIDWTSATQNLSTSGSGTFSDIQLTDAASQIVTDATTNSLTIAGGSSASNGGNIVLYGGTHATTPNRIDFRIGSSSKMYWDQTNQRWDLGDADFLSIGDIDFANARFGRVTVDSTNGVHREGTSSYLGLAGGSNINSGANILLYGSSEASTPFDVLFRSNNTTTELHFDYSTNTWDFQVNAITTTGSITGSNLSGTNTGDQTSIAGITGTKAQFDTACTDGDFLYVGDVTGYTHPDHTGDVSSSGDGATTINTSWVTNMPNVTTGALQTSDEFIFLDGGTQYAAVTYGILLADIEGDIDHNNLTNSGGNAHIDWTSASTALSTSSTITGSSFTSTSTTGLIRNVTNSSMLVGGGNSTTNGSNMVLYGGSATTANDIRFRVGGTTICLYDDSGDIWNFQAKDITTTGNVTATNLSGTNTGDQNVFSTITITDTDSGYTWAETGSANASGNDTLTFVSGSGIDIDVDTGGAIRIESTGGGGSVTSVAVSGTDGIEVDSGSPITTAGTITLGLNTSTLETNLNHDNLTGFVGNEHIDWTSATSTFSTTGDGTFGSIFLDGSEGIYFEANKHAITWNDGTGNFNIRVGNTDQSSVERVTEAGYPFQMEWAQSTGILGFNVGSASGAVDDTITWREQIQITPTTVSLRHSGSNKLTTASDGVDVTGQVEATTMRITAATDVGLATTDHGFQIGTSTGLNIRMDNNEIMAVNNGAASTLYIQNDGGTTSFGGNITTTGTVDGVDVSTLNTNFNAHDGADVYTEHDCVFTFDTNGSGPGDQRDGLYIADLGTTQGTTLNPTYTIGLFAQTSSSRSIGFAADATRAYFFRSHSNAGTYTFKGLALQSELSAKADVTHTYDYLYGDNGTIARSTDEWLRLNDGNSHTTGIYCGSSQVRTDGFFQVGGTNIARLGTSYLRLYEAADHATTFPNAGVGELWLKNTTPNTLIFTDDAGTDHDLTAGGGSGTVTSVSAGSGMSFTTITTSGSVAVAAAQTTITSMYNTTLQVGYNSSNKIDFNSSDFDVIFDGLVDFRFNDGGIFEAEDDVVAFSSSITSDRKVKKDFEPIENALDMVQEMHGQRFTMRKNDRRKAGLIAQDVMKVLPEAVTERKFLQEPDYLDEGEETDTYLSLDYDAVVGVLVEAVKELSSEVEALKAQINKEEA